METARQRHLGAEAKCILTELEENYYYLRDKYETRVWIKYKRDFLFIKFIVTVKENFNTSYFST